MDVLVNGRLVMRSESIKETLMCMHRHSENAITLKKDDEVLLYNEGGNASFKLGDILADEVDSYKEKNNETN